MTDVYAYYNKSNEFSAHRIIKVGLMRGAEAMHFEGESVSCTEEIKEGWYYDENSQKFMTAQEFEINREKYRTSTLPTIEMKMPEYPHPSSKPPEINIDDLIWKKNPKHEKQ